MSPPAIAATPSQPSAAGSWRELARAARSARARSDHDGALLLLRQALVLAPDELEPAVDVATALRELGRLDEAQAWLDDLLQRHPGAVSAWISRGYLARRRGRRDDALASFQRALALQPQRFNVALEIATELRELGRFDEADQAAHEVLASQPASVAALVALAHTARRRGWRDDALMHFRQALALDPGRSDLPLEIATELRELGRLDDCEALLESLPAGGDRAGARWLQRGWAAQYRDHGDEALRCFEQAIAAAPQDVGGYLALAAECRRLGWFDRAERQLRAGLECATPAWRLELELARLERARGHLYDALERTRLVLALQPAAFEAQSLLLLQLVQLARFDEADTLLDTMATGHPQQAVALALHRATLARARYDLPAAERHLKELLRLQPDHAEALHLRALVALMRGDSGGAASQLDAARRLLQSQPSMRRREAASGGLRTMIWRESRTNPFAERALRAAMARPEDQQLAVLAEVVHEEPGHFGSAVAWLVALHRSRAWQRWRPAAGAAAIPRTVVQFWDAADVPPDIRETMASWAQHCSGFEHRIFDDAGADAFIAAECGPRVLRAFRSANHPAMRSDLFRLAWLLVRGGVYADADDLCRRSVEPWLLPGTELVLLQEDIASIGNNFIAAAPRHPFIAAMVEAVVDNILGRQGETVWFISGPGAMTTAFCRHFHATLAQARLPDGVRVFDVYQMQQQAISMHLPRSYKQDERHWSKAREAARPLFRPPLAGTPVAALGAAGPPAARALPLGPARLGGAPARPGRRRANHALPASPNLPCTSAA